MRKFISALVASSLIVSFGVPAATAQSSDNASTVQQSELGSFLINKDGIKYREITAEERIAANQFAEENGEPELPEEFATLVFLDGGYITPGDDDGNPLPLARSGGLGTAWKVTKCAAHISATVLPAGAAFRAIKGLGGVRKAATLLVKAGNRSDFRKIAGGATAEILGISRIEDNCFRGW